MSAAELFIATCRSSSIDEQRRPGSREREREEASAHVEHVFTKRLGTSLGWGDQSLCSKKGE